MTRLGDERRTVTLAEFLLARLDEDEQMARAATAGPWSWEGDEFDGEPASCPHGDEWANHGPDLMSGRDEVISATGYDSSSIFVKRGDAEHIARHDPARVLAECEAKRRIVELHATTWIERAKDEMQPCRSCPTCDPYPHVPNPGPCATLRLLALPYADHPDYRAEWRPAP